MSVAVLRAPVRPWRRDEPAPAVPAGDQTEDPSRVLRFQRVRTATQATLLILVMVSVMLFLFSPATRTLPLVPLIALLVAAALGAVTVAYVPWDRLMRSRVGMLVFYAWSVFDILLITMAIAATGAGSSELFYLYGLTTTLFAISYASRGQTALLGLTFACYLGVLAADGWQVSPTALVLRMSVLGTLAFMGSFLSREMHAMLQAQYGVTLRLRELDELRSDFLSTVSHELRTPLTAIGGLTVTLSRHWERMSDDMRGDLLGRVENNAHELDRLISQLLDFSRVEKGQLKVQLKACDLARIVDDTIAKLDRSLADHPVEVDIPPGTVVLADPAACTRIVQNLLTNAAKFSPGGSPIRVSARTNDREHVVTVADEGIGIAADETERIFERFYRVERSDIAREGTGIGLAIVKQFVEAMAGRVWVDSTPGRGSAFHFTLM